MGISAAAPHAYAAEVVQFAFEYHVPLEGRNTPMSVQPSPLWSPGSAVGHLGEAQRHGARTVIDVEDGVDLRPERGGIGVAHRGLFIIAGIQGIIYPVTLDEFKTTVSSTTPPAVRRCSRARHGARRLGGRAPVAQDVDDESGAWVHAYLHRKEGDWNAGYWYRRAQQPVATDALERNGSDRQRRCCLGGCAQSFKARDFQPLEGSVAPLREMR